MELSWRDQILLREMEAVESRQIDRWLYQREQRQESCRDGVDFQRAAEIWRQRYQEQHRVAEMWRSTAIACWALAAALAAAVVVWRLL